MKPAAPAPPRAELGVWIVGVAWQAPTAEMAPFVAPSQRGSAAGASGGLIAAALTDAGAAGAELPMFTVADGLTDHGWGAPPQGEHVSRYPTLAEAPRADHGWRAPQAERAASYPTLAEAPRADRGRRVPQREGSTQSTFAEALLAAVAALQSGTTAACLVGVTGAGSDSRAAALHGEAREHATEPPSGAWCVLETVDSARTRGAAPYAALVAAGWTAEAAALPAELRGGIGWLELPGGPSACAAAEQVFAPTAEVVKSALRSARTSGGEEKGAAEKGVRDGLALVRAALALGHKVLPRPPAAGPAGTALRPWIQPLPHAGWASSGAPRQAGWLASEPEEQSVYVLLREEASAPSRPDAIQLSHELFVFGADSPVELREKLVALHGQLQRTPQPPTGADLASLAEQAGRQARGQAPYRLALVAGSLGELERQLAELADQLATHAPADWARLHRPSSGRYFGTGTAPAGTTAFLFPGLGASYPYMLGDLCVHFPAVREVFDSIDYVAAQLGEATVPSQQVFPSAAEPPGDSATGAAVVTLLMAEWALAELLRDCGVVPDALMGCSTGEFAALCQGGALDAVAALPVFFQLSLGVARGLPAEQLAGLQSVLVTTAAQGVQPLLAGAPGALYLSADLGPDCALLVGERVAVKWLVEQLESRGTAAHLLPSGIPYHTPLVQSSMGSGAAALGALTVCAPRLPIWSCATARPYAAEPAGILDDASALFVRAIALRDTVEAMYSAGVRTFIEVGPGDGLCRRVDAILRGRPHVSLASNVQQRTGTAQLLHLLAALHALGHPTSLTPLFRHRRRAPGGAPQVTTPGPSAQDPAAAPAVARPAQLERLGSALPALTLDLPCSERWFCLWIDRRELRQTGSELALDSGYEPMAESRGSLPIGPQSPLCQLAARRAVQELVRRLLHRRVELSAIELRCGPAGELRATGDFVGLLGGEPTIAVADCGDAAVALVAAPELAARIGVEITRAQALPLKDAPTALCRALADDPRLTEAAVHVAAVDPFTGWINLQAPGYPTALHARAFRVRNHFITLAVVPRSAA